MAYAGHALRHDAFAPKHDPIAANTRLIRRIDALPLSREGNPMTEAQAAATRFCARVIGPYYIVMAITLLTRQHTFELLLPPFMQNAPLVLTAGAFTLIAGLVLFTGHHHWSSPAAIAISLTGILAALKGASLMAAPEFGAQLTAITIRAPLLLQGAAVLLLLFGAWLSFVGWFAKRSA